LSFGCPVLVSERCGCVPDLVIDGQTGFVVHTGDASDLADKMEAVITLQSDIAASARRCVDQVAPFSPERSAEQILTGCLAMAGVAATDSLPATGSLDPHSP
jgi:glycosyltransferase involved in cell wall biosynthesis